MVPSPNQKKGEEFCLGVRKSPSSPLPNLLGLNIRQEKPSVMQGDYLRWIDQTQPVCTLLPTVKCHTVCGRGERASTSLPLCSNSHLPQVLAGCGSNLCPRTIAHFLGLDSYTIPPLLAHPRLQSAIGHPGLMEVLQTEPTNLDGESLRNSLRNILLGKHVRGAPVV